jgi:hypothetical protein
MKLFLSDHTPCHAFMDVAHFNSHVKFFKDHQGIVTKDHSNESGNEMLISSEMSSDYHTIESNDDGVAAAYLTASGERACVRLCQATTVHGMFLSGRRSTLSAVVSTGDETDTIVETIPPYNVYQAVTNDGRPADVLDEETIFEQVLLGEESAIFSGTGQGPVSVQVSVSAAIISLFVHGGLAEDEDMGQIPRHLCQLEMNTRAMTQMNRLYDASQVVDDEAKIAQGRAETMSDEAGLVVTAQGRGKHGNHFSVVPIYITPFSFARGEDAPEGSAIITSIESVMDVPHILKGDPRGILITLKEVVDLWDVLLPGMDVLKHSLQENNTTTDSEAYATKVFSILLATMQQVYGGLKTCADWSKLYARLSQSKELRDYDFLRVRDRLSWPERNYMVYQLMGAVTKLRVSLLDGLGRVCATKLACMSRYPQVSKQDLYNPNRAYYDSSGPQKFKVVGRVVTVECVALNQGLVLDSKSLNMCKAFSKGILKRVNQATNTAFADFLNEFLVCARKEGERKKYWLGNTDMQMDEILKQRRMEAYRAICDGSTNNNHLQKLQHSLRKPLPEVLLYFESITLGENSAQGVCQAKSDRGNNVFTWLVCLLTSTFSFARENQLPGEERSDCAHSQMMIFVRNNGIRSLEDPGRNTLYQGVASSFKVC